MTRSFPPLALAGLLAACLSTPARADCADNGSQQKFSPYQENFAMLNQMDNTGWAGRDEPAVRVQYSTKYSFVGCPLDKDWHSAATRAQNLANDNGELFLAYTGRFDFYMTTRYSDPVINRMSNIGLHYRLPARLTGFLPAGLVELGLEHRSTGQVFEPTEPANTAALEAAYQRADDDARHLFDTLSRGSNYLSAQLGWRLDSRGGAWRLRVKHHVYLSQNTEITWGPLKNQGITIRNYDLAQFGVEFESHRYGIFSANWRVGTSGLNKDSLDLTWRTAYPNFPLFVRAHLGPMNTLSNYTQRQDSLGIGFLFFH